MNEKNIYSYMGPIFRYGRIIKLLLEPIRTEATSVDGAFEDFVLRLSKVYGNGTSINKDVIHLERKPIPVRQQFTSVQQVVEHFEQQEAQQSTPEPVETVSEASEGTTEGATTEKPKRTRKKTTTENTEGANE